MPQLNIRVGASLDRSLNVAFAPLAEGAKRARQAVESELNKASRSISTETRKGTKDAEARFRELEREIMTGMPKAAHAGTAAVRDFAKETSTHFNVVKKSFSDLAREAESAMHRIEKAGRNPTSVWAGLYGAMGGTKGVKAGLSRGAGIAAGIGGMAARSAMRLGMSYAHGIGVDTDLSSIFHKNAELEQGATALSNAGVIKEDPRNRDRVDPKELMQQVLDTSMKTGTDANQTLEGLRKFVDLTGDLATGREVIGDMEMLAKATGTSMEDMVAAAGEIALALGPVENKAFQLKTLMNQFAAQGERGANAIRLLAPNMAKIAASATQFEGDRGQNLVLLGALGQESRKGGGASTTTQSATSIASLVNTLKTPARIKAFHAAGVDVSNSATGKLLNPEEIIMKSIKAAGGDNGKWKSMWGNVQGERSPTALRQIYMDAGGGAAGESAVRNELDKLKKAYIDEEQMRTSFAAAMRTQESQAQLFNNQIRVAAMRLQENMLPALVNVTPELIKFANGLVGVTSWLIGSDAATKNKVNASKEDADSLIKNSEKQLASGFLYEGQQKATSQAENRAWDAYVRAGGGEYKGQKFNGELEKAKDDQTGALGGAGNRVLQGLDLMNPGTWIAKMFGGSSFGDVLDKKYAKEDANVKEKEDQAAVAKESWQRLHDSNQELLRRIEGGIQVRVVEMPQVPGKPPPTPSDGRQPSPEE